MVILQIFLHEEFLPKCLDSEELLLPELHRSTIIAHGIFYFFLLT